MADTDVLVMILPNHPSTAGAMNAERFAELKPGAVLVNVGRGSTVDEDALVAALESGRLAAAAIDVTATEPLPADSPLWDQPNLLITRTSREAGRNTGCAAGTQRRRRPQRHRGAQPGASLTRRATRVCRRHPGRSQIWPPVWGGMIETVTSPAST
nr:NAD(P)-dependent oxidoreductase [Tessaracoccus coleopterorum]